MTTNVFDRTAGLLATDSRWSFQIPYAVVYVDDVAFEKIACDDKLAYMFAGDSQKIREWKEWIANPGRAVINRPRIQGKQISLCLVDIAERKVVFDRNQDIFSDDYRFAGTGAIPAHHCWSKNKDPRKAVETAKLADRFSGGQVKYFDLSTREHNLLAPDRYEALREGALEKGMVMYFQNPPHIPLKEAAANDTEVKKAVEGIMKGDISLSAPSPSVENEWSDQDLARLDVVLAKYYPKT